MRRWFQDKVVASYMFKTQAYSPSYFKIDFWVWKWESDNECIIIAKDKIVYRNYTVLEGVIRNGKPIIE